MIAREELLKVIMTLADACMTGNPALKNFAAGQLNSALDTIYPQPSKPEPSQPEQPNVPA